MEESATVHLLICSITHLPVEEAEYCRNQETLNKTKKVYYVKYVLILTLLCLFLRCMDWPGSASGCSWCSDRSQSGHQVYMGAGQTGYREEGWEWGWLSQPSCRGWIRPGVSLAAWWWEPERCSAEKKGSPGVKVGTHNFLLKYQTHIKRTG